MDVSENRGTPKSSILIGFSILNHSFGVPLFLETPICVLGIFFSSFLENIAGRSGNNTNDLIALQNLEKCYGNHGVS